MKFTQRAPLFLFLYMFTALFFVAVCTNAIAQDSTYIRSNAIRIDKPEKLNREVYEAVKDYQVIMVGELHGTNEPADLVIALANLLLKYENGNIQVGLEIPSNEMKEFLSTNSSKNIATSQFFAKKSVDGRASVAWTNVLSKLNNNPRIEFFFYDINEGDVKDINERDSVMYIKIKNKIMERPGYKTITLSGNVHNMLLPFREKTKMALYLQQDKELNISQRILSINHVYGGGTMLNNQGNGVKLNSVDNSDSKYAKAVDYDWYFMILPPVVAQRYNAVFFSRKLTGATLVTPP